MRLEPIRLKRHAGRSLTGANNRITTLSSANTLTLAIRSIRLKYARAGIRASCSLTTSISSVWRIDRRA
jgi:hypothetical protein